MCIEKIEQYIQYTVEKRYIMTSNGSSGGERLVGRFTESVLLKKAKEVVAEKSKESEMFDEEAEKAMPRFKKSGKCRAEVG